MERLTGQPASALASRGASLAVQSLAVFGLCVFLGQQASKGGVGKESLALLLLIVVALALTVPPHALIALALLVFGAYSLSANHPLGFGGAQVYSTDALLAIVLLRAILPRERSPSQALDGVARLLFALWAVVMVVAGLRGAFGGYALIPIIRLEVPLIYAVGFYFGFGRILRERGFDFNKAVRNLLIVALGLVAYMAFARLTNRPFETNRTIGRLGDVMTTTGELRRDYGFASAFIMYPALALAAAAYLLYSPRRTILAATAAAIGTLATLVTLVRSQIFGLGIGLAVIVLLGAEGGLRRVTRTRAVVAASFAFLIGGLGLWAVSPPTAHGVVERSLPGVVRQTESATHTAEYRRQALHAGFAAAKRKPEGVGLIPDELLTAKTGVDLGYLAHSGVTTMLVYSGWIGLAAAMLALVGLLWASFRLAQPIPWLHPFFVSSLLLLAVYTVTADGLLGQGWVMGLAALIAALRFNIDEEV